jgi:hypothetical protein
MHGKRLSACQVSRETDERNSGSAENFCGYVLHLMGKNQAVISHFARSIEQGRPGGWPERNVAILFSPGARRPMATRTTMQHRPAFMKHLQCIAAMEWRR